MKLPDRDLRFDRRLSGGLIVMAMLACLAIDDAYLLRLLAIAGCYAILAIGYQRLFGELGVLSLAQGAFFAIGGYAMAIFSLRTGWDGAVLLPLAVVAAATLALIVAPPLLKLASHYFALASLAVAQLVLLGVVNLESLTGGANGLSPLPPLALGGWAVKAGSALSLVVWGGVALCAALFWLPGALAALRRHVLRDAPLAAQALGLDPARWRLAAFVFAAACAGLAGVLYVPATGVVAPDIAELAIMINVLAMTVIGGRGRVAGAIVGALILAFLPEFLRFLGGWQLFAWGAAMLLVLIVAPAGIVGLLQQLLPDRPVAAVDGTADAVRTHPPGGTLKAHRVGRAFGGVVALADASLEIRGSEIVALIGANGAGKTTLLNILSGFERSDGGRIFWRGGEVTRLATHDRARLGIGRSFQIDQLPGDIALIDAVATGVPQVATLAEARSAAVTILRQLSLDSSAWTELQALPPATRRLADIARALAAWPGLLLLDEPTSGLTQAERAGLADALRDLRRRGVGLLIVEHDLPFILPLADRLICLERGRIVAEGSPDALMSRPELRSFFVGHARQR